MKKISAIMLSLTLAGSILTGCANTNEPAPTPEENKVLQIYFVRHGKTFFNSTDQVQGFADTPLTEKGIEQAITLGKGLADVQFTTAYTGELGRQRKTAQLILGENNNDIPQIVEHVGFNEWNYGGYEGKMNAEMWDPIFAEAGAQFDPYWSEYGKVLEYYGGDRALADAIAKNDPIGAAETYDEILERAQKAMDQLVEESLAAGGGNVLVVSSGSQIPTILELIAPGVYDGSDEISNCSVSIVTYQDGTYTIDMIGDTSYLGE